MNVNYTKAPHAPLIERYVAGDFERVGEPKHRGADAPRIDPETGAEYRALGRGGENKYLRDYKVGASYPANVFVHVTEGGESLDHEAAEEVLKAHGLWSDNLSRVNIPGAGDGWYHGFMYRPIETAPDLDAVEGDLSALVGADRVYAAGNAVEAYIPEMEADA